MRPFGEFSNPAGAQNPYELRALRVFAIPGNLAFFGFLGMCRVLVSTAGADPAFVWWGWARRGTLEQKGPFGGHLGLPAGRMLALFAWAKNAKKPALWQLWPAYIDKLT